jgi:hypothetical protein
MKDLVNSPVKKYQDIFDTITNNNTNANYNKYLPTTNEYAEDYTEINLLPTENSNTNANSSGMKDELKYFLKKQLNTTSELDGIGFGQNSGYGSVL